MEKNCLERFAKEEHRDLSGCTSFQQQIRILNILSLRVGLYYKANFSKTLLDERYTAMVEVEPSDEEFECEKRGRKVSNYDRLRLSAYAQNCDLLLVDSSDLSGAVGYRLRTRV